MSGARETAGQEARGEAYTIFSDLSEVTRGAGGPCQVVQRSREVLELSLIHI